MIGFALGSLLVCTAMAATKHYKADTTDAANQCVLEATSTTRVSMPIDSDGLLEVDQAVCWPDGIDGESDTN